VIKSGNKEPSKSTSWKVPETVMSHLKCFEKSLLMFDFKVSFLGKLVENRGNYNDLP